MGHVEVDEAMSIKEIVPGFAHFFIKLISRKQRGHELSHQAVTRGSDVTERLLFVDEDEERLIFDNKERLFIRIRDDKNV